LKIEKTTLKVLVPHQSIEHHITQQATRLDIGGMMYTAQNAILADLRRSCQKGVVTIREYRAQHTRRGL
jgi:hypothetical protein